MVYTPNQISDAFTKFLDRPPTDFEIKKYSTASPQTIVNLKDTYSKYNPNSLSDYLASKGQDNSLAAREALGQQYGISGIGTAEGNTALLTALKEGRTPTPAQVNGSVYTASSQPINQAAQQETPVQVGDRRIMGDQAQVFGEDGNWHSTQVQPDLGGSVQTAGATMNADTPNDITADPGVVASKKAVDEALTGYQGYQRQVADIDNQIAKLRQTIQGAMKDKEEQAAASGGVVSRAQIASEVAFQTQGIQKQINELLNQRAPLAAAQSQYSKILEQARKDYTDSQNNYFKAANLSLAKDKQETSAAQNQARIEQGQQKIDTQASQFNQKQEQQQSQFAQKLEQAGWKSSKVNQYDEYGNVVGQKVVWTQNPSDKTGFDQNGQIVSVNNSVPTTTINLINNAGGIKWTGAKWQTDLGAKDSGIKAADGGTFALFPTIDAGNKAQRYLFTSSTYSNLTVDQALKKWSNNGYGAEIVPSIDKNTKVSALTPQQVDSIMQAQKVREGYGSSTSGSDVAAPKVNMASDATVDMSSPGYATSTVLYEGKDTQLTQAYIDKTAIAAIMNGGVIPSGAVRGTRGLPMVQTNAIKARIGQLDPGGNLALNKTMAQAWGKNLGKQIEYATKLERSLNSADADLQQVIANFKGKVNDKQAPIANIIANFKKYNLNPGDVSAYKASIQEIQRIYAQVFSTGGSVQGTNIAAKDVIDGNISVSDLEKVANQLQALGKIDVEKAYDQVKKAQSEISNIVPGVNSANSSQNTVKIGDQNFTVGQIFSDGKYNYSVAPDGSLWRNDGKHIDGNTGQVIE